MYTTYSSVNYVYHVVSILYIPSTCLSYNWHFVLFDSFCHFSLPLLTCLHHKSDLFFYDFVFLKHNWPITLCYCYTALVMWFFNAFQVITISLVTICHYARYYIIIDYILHTVHFIPVIHLFCNWKLESTPLDLLPLFGFVHLFCFVIFHV